MSVQFTVPGRLCGKGRPRISTRNGQIRAFTPKKTRNMEAVLRDFAQRAMHGRLPIEGPVRLNITICINHPQSWSKKKKQSTHHVTGKPDADNQIKLFDACNGVLWRDDSQIAQLIFQRLYVDGPEHVDVIVTALDDVASVHPHATRFHVLFEQARQ